MTTLILNGCYRTSTSIPGETTADVVAWDDDDALANTLTGTVAGAWRGLDANQNDKHPQCIRWRRAREGETSRDGLWVVGGSQWRYGC